VECHTVLSASVDMVLGVSRFTVHADVADSAGSKRANECTMKEYEDGYMDSS